ncbi:hypothetical protein [Methylobacterium sp. Leaf118]|uniref:hypothetical protein n=1 Tax=Methylobacterium sp. Leaf118 TaxID=2876562 RepID=UPI001E478C2D|nr:hypothetical protein [Methylobacterium sp. Leaf118]
MAYTVKLAVFPPWRAPVPYETLAETFPTQAVAALAGAYALAPSTERERAERASELQPRSTTVEGRAITSVPVPEDSVHGDLIYDRDGVEVGNWTTLDVASERADRDDR